MTRLPIPTDQLTRRLPELGRIRTGVKTERAMKAIDTFRFTSSDVTALGQIAATYGGEVKPWSDDKAADGQYEVITDEYEIHVALPPDPLGGTPRYELYGGGGRERWCNGVTCETWQPGPDGPEPTDVACICVAKESMECKPTVHLAVLLPEVRGVGTWRLTTHSWNAAQELPGMVDLVRSLQDRGITRATLRLERKRSVRAGTTRKFIVPVLGVDGTVAELAAGSASIGSLAPAPRAIDAGPLEIEAGTDTSVPDAISPASTSPDAAGEGQDPAPAPSPGSNPVTEFHEAIKAAVPDDQRSDLRHAVIARATANATEDWREADRDEALPAATELARQVGEGSLELFLRATGEYELRPVGGGSGGDGLPGTGVAWKEWAVAHDLPQSEPVKVAARLSGRSVTHADLAKDPELGERVRAELEGART